MAVRNPRDAKSACDSGAREPPEGATQRCAHTALHDRIFLGDDRLIFVARAVRNRLARSRIKTNQL